MTDGVRTLLALAGLACLGTWAQAQVSPGPPGPVTYFPLIPGPPQPLPPDGAVSNPYAGNASAIQEGGRLFSWYNCSGCHAPQGGGGMGPPLSDDDWIYGSSPASIFNSIWEGRPNGMPAWAGRLPADEVWKMVAYIETLPGDNPAWAP